MQAEFPRFPDFRRSILTREPEWILSTALNAPVVRFWSRADEEIGDGQTGLSIVIPAWNEEDRLARTLDQYIPALEARLEPFEVIVVVDGVSDRTAQVAERFANRNVRVLRFPTKLGKGGAILAGLREARYDYVGYLDADGPISPEQVHGLVEDLREVDCVVASRWIRGASGVDEEPLFNRFAGRVWNFLARSLLFLPLRDTQCGAKFFRRSVVTPLLRTVTLTNRAFDVDFLYHIRKTGGRVKEVPVTWTHNRDTRMPIGRAIPVMFLSLVGVRIMNLPIANRVPHQWVQWFISEFGGS
jgi:glycosyltransferase involved in cell wall biosynthesis